MKALSKRSQLKLKQQEQDEFVNFRQWVRSLSRDDLLKCMQFVFQPAPSSTLSPTGSHEFDLLLEMVQLQSPPPTPVHPRALSYRPASSKGAQLDYGEAKLRFLRPRMFQWNERRSSKSKDVFDVVARKKVTPWGQVLGLGSTSRQQQADRRITECTQLISSKTEGNLIGIFVVNDNEPFNILDMLWIASRGMFMSICYPKNQSTTSTSRRAIIESKRSISFCAPWFDPTDRWFSLPMYLASRFEVALWMSFRSRARQQVTALWDPPVYSEQILERALPRAMKRAMIEIFKHATKKRDVCKTIRDELIWSLTVEQSEFNRPPKSSRECVTLQKMLRAYSMTPMLDIHSFIHQFRLVFVPHMQQAIANEVENELLSGPTTTIAPNNKNNDASSTKKGKNKKRKQKKNQGKQVEPSKCNNGDDDDNNNNKNDYDVCLQDKKLQAGFTSCSDNREGMMEDNNENSQQIITINHNESCLEFPNNPNITSMQRNKNIVLALSIIEKVLDATFAKVGLPPEKNSYDDNALPVPPGGKVAPDPIPQKSCHLARPVSNLFTDASQKSNKNKKKKIKQHQLQHNQFNTQQKDAKNSRRETESHVTISKSEEGKSNTPPEAVNKSCTISEMNTMPSPYSPFDGATFGFHDDSNHGNDFSSLVQYSPILEPRTSYNGLSTFSNSDKNNPFHSNPSLGGGGGGSGSGGFDDWPFGNRYQNRNRSILAEFFRTQEERDNDDEKLMVASTAASIASSTYNKDIPVVDVEDGDKDIMEVDGGEVHLLGPEMNAIVEDDRDHSLESSLKLDGKEGQIDDDGVIESSSKQLSARIAESPTVSFVGIEGAKDHSDLEIQANKSTPDIPSSPPHVSTPPPRASPTGPFSSPQAPVTPPPTLSPILVTLADLRELKKTVGTPERFLNAEIPKKSRSFSVAAASGSLPSSPMISSKNGLTPSWSREDLRIASFRDDHNIKQKRNPPLQRPSEPPTSYRAAAIKSLAKPIASSKGAKLDLRGSDSSLRREQGPDSCARSETAIEGHGDDQHWVSDGRKVQSPPHGQEEADNNTVTRDEITTITSALSQRESEEISSIREERNSFRDMCLTLGAEVAKLKAMLAAQKASVPAFDYAQEFPQQMLGPGSIDPNSMSPFFHGMNRGQRLGPMSDAGLQRAGDHESQVSEDEVYDAITKSRTDNIRRMSSSATVVGSDVSVEYNSSGTALQSGSVGIVPVQDSISSHGLQSRLTKDIRNFLNSTNIQLRKMEGRRQTAIERFTRLVNTLWPRAQVKRYGSYVSGLCLPSSDLDFVICLPAVHKNAPALAPGVLEGRNAINESSQKLLARQLKGESWIDPRSIKLIERTVVPVIKVSTKDTKARMLQLDISFDSPEHHGLEAIEMVLQILEELPLIRPLVLVLKQFLLDRALLTAYTGGLSSYCLFLMVARYLQEQPSSCGDCGSLLMGFLDFYGNCFDPRTTGISVRRRQYFARPNYVAAQHNAHAHAMWNVPPPHQQHIPKSPQMAAGHVDYLRRNSFSDNSNVDGTRGPPPPPPPPPPPASMSRPPRFQPASSSSVAAAHRFASHNMGRHGPQHDGFGRGRPFTFDPLFVEDPLSAGNNVGRNAFRIFQVQRAFSDAQRALVASLEWDIHSSGELNDGVDYPLLKCLLRSEDVVYEL